MVPIHPTLIGERELYLFWKNRRGDGMCEEIEGQIDLPETESKSEH